jgi:hypothetical protein
MTRHELGEEQLSMRLRNVAAEQNVTTNTVDPSVRPFTVTDLMSLHALSRPTIIALYENERGVQIIENTERQKQCNVRKKRVIRVPRHVYARVRRRMEVQ